MDIAENYIKSNIHWRVEFTGSLQRTEIPEVPIEAIREALLNSFCHKDYASGESNEVAIYKDRIEIYNPGRFPEGFEPQDFIDKPERPIRRNPKIARTLYYSKEIESFGTGLKRISDACAAAGVKYEFEQLKSGFVVCFYRTDENANKRYDVHQNEKINELLNQKMSEIKNEPMLQIVDYLKENGQITSKIGTELTGKSLAQVKRYLKALEEMNVVKKSKSRKGNVYIMNQV